MVRYLWRFARESSDALDLLIDEVFDLADDIVEDLENMAAGNTTC